MKDFFFGLGVLMVVSVATFLIVGASVTACVYAFMWLVESVVWLMS